MEWYQLQTTTPGTLNVIQHAYGIYNNIAFYNTVYAAKYLHKQCESIKWYIISFFKLHIGARVSMNKADELAVNVTFLLYINTTIFTNYVCIPH
jgi:hypothetical protein